MRWSIVRLIWMRELRDQLRDRRTLFMVAGLPVLIYPILGVVVLTFAASFADSKTVIGIVDGPSKPREFPPRPNASAGRHAAPAVSWLALTPAFPGEMVRVDHLAGATALAAYSHICLDFPLLAHDGKIDPLYLPRPTDKSLMPVRGSHFQIEWLEERRRDLLEAKKIDLLLSSEANFWDEIESGRPTLKVESRDNDEQSRLAMQRLNVVLARWKKHIKEVRFTRYNLRSDYDEPFRIEEPDASASPNTRNILNTLVRIFPFMLVMWSLAGALYPAIDLCAGEKERGTMETLLISPAGREEIVMGKFLTIWIFSAGTAFLNIASMGLTTWAFAGQLPQLDVRAEGLFWCLVLLLPLSAFFSAVCLAIGAYAAAPRKASIT